MMSGAETPGELGAPRAGSAKALLTVQALRGVAAVLVVVHHVLILMEQRVTHVTTPYWTGGARGVDIFFVLSGLVMVLSSGAMRGMRDAGKFLARRLERVAPMYWLATLAKILVLVAVPAMALRADLSWWHVVTSFLFLPPGGADSMVPILVVGWTLSFEVYFYLLFAVSLVLRVRPLSFLLPALCFSAAFALLPRAHQPAILLWLDPIVLEFLYGVLLGSLVKAKKLPGKWVSVLLLVAGFAALLLPSYPFGEFSRPFIYGLPALAIVTGAVGLEGLVRERLPVWLLSLGDSSYSLYLTHGLVLPVLGVLLARVHATGWLAFAGAVAVITAVCIAVGELCFRGVERPLVRYFQGRRRSATPVTV